MLSDVWPGLVPGIGQALHEPAPELSSTTWVKTLKGRCGRGVGIVNVLLQPTLS